MIKDGDVCSARINSNTVVDLSITLDASNKAYIELGGYFSIIGSTCAFNTCEIVQQDTAFDCNTDYPVNITDSAGNVLIDPR